MSTSAGNGLGPYWFPDIWRAGLTRLSSLFFDEANWQKHDEGYARQHPARSVCDRKMLSASLRDASQANSVLAIFFCVGLSWFFWALVRVFGWVSYYRRH